MTHRFNFIWDVLFHPERAARKIPAWLGALGRFCYLVAKEFSRNRCLEKASALGFQTVFSMIPAIVVAMFFFHAFGVLDDLGGAVQQFLYHQFNVDMIHITIPGTEESISLADKIQELVDGVFELLRVPGVSFVPFIWLVLAVMSLLLTMERSLNAIWGASGRRGVIRRIALYWSVLTLGTLLLGVSIYAARRLGTALSSEGLIGGALVPLVSFYLLYQLVPSAPVRPIAALAGC